MKLKTNIKISAPAAIANVACGFDVLGLAINTPKDEIIIKEASTPGIHISQIINNPSDIPLSIEANTAGFAAQQLLDHLIKTHGYDDSIGLDLKIIKHIPIGYGLGSSSSSAAAAVMAINEAFRRPLEKRALVKFAALGEALAENSFKIHSVAPSLIGGFVLTRDHQTIDFHRLPHPKGLHIAIVYPNDNILISRHIRNNLTHRIKLEQAIHQVANVGALVHALYTSDLELLARTLEDHIIEQYWSNFIPFFDEIQSAALKNGALGCSIAGTGSGIFAICQNSLEAQRVGKTMQDVLANESLKNTLILTSINKNGALLE